MTAAALTTLSNQLTAVRYYGQFDPYHYSVDNRPLTDLDANTGTTVGVLDAARRGAMLSQILRSVLDKNRLAAIPAIEGLTLSQTSSSPVIMTVAPGVFYSSVLLDDSVGAASYVKPAMLIAARNFTITPVTPSLTNGQSICFLIQCKYSDLSPSTAFPFINTAASTIQSHTTVGELTLGIKQGTAAATGSQVAPTVDAGWTPLYEVTLDYGSSTPTFKFSASAPSRAKASHTSIPTIIKGVALNSTIFNLTVGELIDSASTQLVATRINPSVMANKNSVDPYKVSINCFTPSTTGSVTLRLRVRAFGLNDTLTATSGWTDNVVLSGSVETFANPNPINKIATLNFAATIPASWFSKDYVEVEIERVTGDSSSVSLYVTSITVAQ